MSPELLTRAEAEALVAKIGKVRRDGTSLDLPWLSVHQSNIVAVYLEPKDEPPLHRLHREESAADA